MSWDIWGTPLRRGHCEVHPHVHEEYPCAICISDNLTKKSAKSEEDAYYRDAYDAYIAEHESFDNAMEELNEELG